MQIKELSEKHFKKAEELIKTEFPYIGATVEKISQRLARPEAFIFEATEKNEFAGFIDLSLFENKGAINGFSVQKKFRNKGIGKKLLEFGIEFLKENGAQKIRLLVKKENEQAKKLYKKQGFKFIGMHPKKISGKEIEEMELIFETGSKNFFEKIVS